MSNAPEFPRPRTTRRALLVSGSMIAGIVLLIAASRFYQYAQLRDYDPSPLPRPRINAPFITTPDAITDKMVELAEITADDVVYDLGCGDGRLVITAAVQRGCRGIGYDIDPKRVAEATENAKKHGVEELVTIQEQDVFKVDLSQADVIMVYLLPWMLKELKSSFENCKPGTRIVSHDFEIDGIVPDQVVEVALDELDHHYVRLYVTPLKKAPEAPKPKRNF